MANMFKTNRYTDCSAGLGVAEPRGTGARRCHILAMSGITMRPCRISQLTDDERSPCPRIT